MTKVDAASVRPVHHARWIALALVPFLVLAVRHFMWQPSADSGDYAQYLAHARAIVEGRPYAQIGYITHPSTWMMGPPAYPPGLPLTLAPIVAVGGIHSVGIKLLMIGSVAVFAAIAYLRLVRDVAPWQAAFGVAATAVAVEAHEGTLAPISDPGFAVLLWALILVVDDARSWSWTRVAFVTLLGAATIGYRIVGAAIVPALGLYAIVTWRTHRGRAIIPPLLWGTGGVIALLQRPAQAQYGDGLVSQLAAIGQRIVPMAREYRWGLGEIELLPLSNAAMNKAWHVVASVLVLVGVVVFLRRSRWSFLLIASAVYLAMLALAPVADTRYLWPVFPILATGLALGADTLVGRPLARLWPARSPAVYSGSLLGAVLLGSVVVQFRQPAPRSLLGSADSQALLEWLRASHARAPMRLAFYNPRVLTLETRVPGMGLPARTAPGQIIAMDERRVSHLIWQRDDLSGCVQRIANTLPAVYPHRFVLEYENATFRAYRLLPPATPEPNDYEEIDWSRSEKWCGPGE